MAGVVSVVEEGAARGVGGTRKARGGCRNKLQQERPGPLRSWIYRLRRKWSEFNYGCLSMLCGSSPSHTHVRRDSHEQTAAYVRIAEAALSRRQSS